MPLGTLAQFDLSAGMWRSVARHLVPEQGAHDLLNLLLDEDGSAYRRGGSAYKSDASFGTGGLRFLWDGTLGGGARTVFANTADFGVLDTDDESPVNIGGAGMTNPRRAVVVDGILFIGGGVAYGGSRLAANYSTGTVAVTNGSTTVTGTGTSWDAVDVDAGMLFRIGSGPAYAIASRDSTTQLTLASPYRGATASGQAYTASVLLTPTRTSDFYVTAGDRLLSLEGNIVYESAPGDPWTFNTAEDNHRLPEGVSLLGGQALGDNALIFTTHGLWVISNLSLELTDADGNVQQRLEEVSRDVVLWANEGIAGYQNGLVVPGTDGVWLMDGISTPRKISTPIEDLYVGYVNAGNKPGLAKVYRSHYFLPILDSSNVFVDLLVCRLDRPVETRLGTVLPWTRMAGFGAEVTCVEQRVSTGGSRQPKLFGASKATAGRVLDLTGFFSPTAALKNDADATTHLARWVTREFQTGALNENMTRRVELRYELVDAASDNPRIAGYYSKGVTVTELAEWDDAQWDVDVWPDEDTAEDVSLSGTAPEDDGRTPYVWRANVKARYIRFRFDLSAPAEKLIFRSVRTYVRQSTRS